MSKSQIPSIDIPGAKMGETPTINLTFAGLVQLPITTQTAVDIHAKLEEAIREIHKAPGVCQCNKDVQGHEPHSSV